MEQETIIQPLLEKIKREGIEEANKAAEEILEKAWSEGASIIEKAQAQVKEMVADAKKEMQERKEAFDVAMSQAGRNLILSVKNETIGVCDYILKRQVASTLTPDAMKELILKIVNGWQVHESIEGLEIFFSESDCQKLEESLYGWLQKELREGLTLRPIEIMRAGFRIGERDGDMHYDIGDKAITEIRSECLHPRTAKFLQEISEDHTDRT
jgi:V/A-type H+-transporting ATPase subunit E